MILASQLSDETSERWGPCPCHQSMLGWTPENSRTSTSQRRAGVKCVNLSHTEVNNRKIKIYQDGRVEINEHVWCH